MSDFIQNRKITNLQMLNKRTLMDIESEIEIYAYDRKVTLLLPSLYSEFLGEAMPKIIKQLETIPYLHRIVLSLDRASEEEFVSVKKAFVDFPCDVKIIWQDSPQIRALYAYLEDHDFYVGCQGKGRGVWFSIGYILAKKDTKVIALHDCDIVNYDRMLLARLVYPLVNPSLSYEFSKGYYSRVSGCQLYGRVTRLYITPLLQALKKIFGPLNFFEFLESFRYILSGEFAIRSDMAAKVRITPDWGLEIATLGEVYSLATPARVCQVELMSNYEHKHQEIKKDDDPYSGLSRMVIDITRSLFRLLSQDGIVFTPAVIRSLRVTYINFARMNIEKYDALAKLNGLRFDRHGEITAVEQFSAALIMASEKFMDDPIGTPLLPGWHRVISGEADFGSRMIEVIDAENG
ncbi:MAG: glycosyl transferase [Deltaproteobacteria bacterium]|nr:glycosyl transferase [Candidatus Anaeroferrophillus wilburensis]MBN2888768.1 glycosyl transferase [Deltaproteobacteria bacterium]